jgi:transcriptional regulator with XRE-family HTH domain
MIIRKLRRERAWTQEQLALILGLNVRTVQRLENGASPSFETAQALASAFGGDARLFLAPEPAPELQSVPGLRSAPQLGSASPPGGGALERFGRMSDALYATAFLLVGGGVASILILVLLIAGPSSPAMTAALFGSAVSIAIGVGPTLRRVRVLDLPLRSVSPRSARRQDRSLGGVGEADIREKLTA